MSKPSRNYQTGRTLGSGTYSVVKEVVDVETGKEMNKEHTRGHKDMVLNEIEMLRRISGGTKNMITLSDYFETSHNIYICYDLCTGGNVFHRVCKKGTYVEGDAAVLVRNLCTDIVYIHSKGIVHGDLKPENLLLRIPENNSPVMIADFGLARELGKDDDGKTSLLTGVHGSPLYMAPEIYGKTGYEKPVDIWALGVITYFLLVGRTPFERKKDKESEKRAILKGDLNFEPLQDWRSVSQTAQDFIRRCLTLNPNERMTAEECLEHEFDLLPKQSGSDEAPMSSADIFQLSSFFSVDPLAEKAKANRIQIQPSPHLFSESPQNFRILVPPFVCLTLE
ncbi:hypothetical protein GYMLUDRAFT_72534 [Collybiopsis luxurians FD-317 M1]|uniref:Protein kinase domain-containing protein n=1 Tax=Collybiopsis luxurians FD-317 M1 TaxID=944289 RepID=A0A0D0D147_9AGAR|nr:hypothetical protein GYMLUDRAFT_72534 [Collybiopsis luxurians FD-317 M1]